MPHRTIPDRVCKTCGAMFRPRTNDRIYCSKRCSDQRSRIPILERLNKSTHIANNGCWEWQAAHDRRGYGKIYYQGRLRSVHTVSWKLAHGPIPQGMEVCHKCDNPACWNPDHLWLGTHQENMEDAITKGRHGNLGHPERYKRGANSFSAQYPERLARGEQHGNAKFTDDDIRNIRHQYEQGTRVITLARRYGVAWSTIDCIVKRKYWQHIT